MRKSLTHRRPGDKVSGIKVLKPEFENLLHYVREGDTVIIWKLDRLGRSTKGLIELVEDLGKRGVHLISLNGPIDTTSPSGVVVFQIFCALAEHKRNVIVQRTQAGLKSARSRKGGRPQGLDLKYQKVAPAVKDLYEAGQKSTTEIMHYFGIGSRRTLYKVLRFAGVEIKAFQKEKARVNTTPTHSPSNILY